MARLGAGVLAVGPMPRSSNVARDKANPQPQRAVGEGGSYACRQCGSVLRRTRLPDHRAHADCPDCDLRHRRKFFCRHCKTFSKRDKFTRDHEFTHDDGCTRCAPGRVPDRTRKWSDEETDVICESQPASHRDLEQLLQRLNRGLKSGDAHTIDSLRRKVEYLGVSGKMARPRDATAPPQLAVPSPPSPPQKREKRAKKDASARGGVHFAARGKSSGMCHMA
mmetsp:Transcript_28899/g.99602  ORF Transcript_28899/g.99602 Transcript_28899/m.99602 type:complete len:222 (-) Transcript_28899:2-667(-)